MTEPNGPPNSRRWWWEAEFVVALVLVAAIYLPRLGAVPVRGEEPRRARIAVEMKETGDWVVPRVQREPFATRPPLHNWMIAACAYVYGDFGPVPIRLPSVVAVFGIVIILYGYTRSFLGRAGALAAAIAYPTTGQILQLGRQAETEAVFVLFLGGAILVWHWGMTRGWRPVATWTATYALAGAAALTKGGLQPPIYLFGAIGVYLLYTRRLRELFTVGHAVGILVGVTPIALWLIACTDRVGWDMTAWIWWRNTANRLNAWDAGKVLHHLAGFPFEVFGSLLPWSPLLLAYLVPSFRRGLDAARLPAIYHAVAAAIAFPTVWLPQDAAARYYSPLYPSLAILGGIVVDRCARRLAPRLVAGGWRHYLSLVAVVFGVLAVATPFWPWIARLAGHPTYGPDSTNAWLYAVLLGGSAVIVWLSRFADDERPARAAVVGVAVGTAALAAGILDDIRIRRSEDHAGNVAQAVAALPPGTQLVSVGWADALFAYYYGPTIPVRGYFGGPIDVAPGEYFCFLSSRGLRPELPFEYEDVSSARMDRFRREPPDKVMIIARRKPE
jgi:4-amino-4-deoxy-L-arabinose transferase-like glycosyltransferase